MSVPVSDQYRSSDTGIVSKLEKTWVVKFFLRSNAFTSQTLAEIFRTHSWEKKK